MLMMALAFIFISLCPSKCIFLQINIKENFFKIIEIYAECLYFSNCYIKAQFFATLLTFRAIKLKNKIFKLNNICCLNSFLKDVKFLAWLIL